MIGFLRRLRFVDYLIILAIVLAGIILFKFFNPEEKWIDAAVSATNVSFSQANVLHVGDFEKNPSGEKIAEITDLQVYDTEQSPAANKDVFIKVKLLVKVNPRSGELEYKNKIIKVGTSLEFRFNSGYIGAKLVDIEGIVDMVKKKTEKTLTIKIYEQWPWFAESIKIGEGERGEGGQRIIEVLSKEVKPAEITVTTSGGETLKRTNPSKVDVTLKVKLQVTEFKNEIIFQEDERVLIGELISFNVGKTRVKDAFIVNIE